MVEQTPVQITQGYQIVSVNPAEPPPGTEGTDWHLYVIAQGANRIEGHRQGKLKAVTQAVEEIVAQLNERRLGKRGRVNLVPSPKKAGQKS
jgi:hypothetical protein